MFFWKWRKETHLAVHEVLSMLKMCISILYLRGFVDSLEGIFIQFSSSHCFCFFLHDILVFLLFFGLLFDSILLSYYFTALILVYFWMFQDIVLSSWLMVISHYFMIILLTCLLWLNVIFFFMQLESIFFCWDSRDLHPSSDKLFGRPTKWY